MPNSNESKILVLTKGVVAKTSGRLGTKRKTEIVRIQKERERNRLTDGKRQKKTGWETKH